MKKLICVTLALLLTTFYCYSQSSQTTNEFKGGAMELPGSQCISEEDRIKIEKEISKNIEILRAQGKITEPKDNSFITFDWPMRANNAFPGFSYYYISNYVDLDLRPGFIADYLCYQKTYDGHTGIDIGLWPFWWNMMDNNYVAAVAATPGTIVYKVGSYYDRNCDFSNPNSFNAIILFHADGSRSWYVHLKQNSLTLKNVGETVIAGEFLGYIGSSGASTGPHLHFEVRDPSNSIIEPFFASQGCNWTTSQSWWNNQLPYVNPKINRIMTHSSKPLFPPCPNPEILNEKNDFVQGEEVWLGTYYRDQQQYQPSTLKILTPNNVEYYTEVKSYPLSYYFSNWFTCFSLGPEAELGTWKFQITFNGSTYSHNFNVTPLNVLTVNNDYPVASSLLQNYPNPFNPTTNIRFDVSKAANVKLTIYDNAGRFVGNLLNNQFQPGCYVYKYSPDALSSSIYYYRIQVDNFIQTKKMLFLK